MYFKNKNYLKYFFFIVLTCENLSISALILNTEGLLQYVDMLKPCSGFVHSSEMLAILALQNVFYSFFLNALFGRIKFKSKISGKIEYNRKEKNVKEWIKDVVLVKKDSFYVNELTIEENIRYLYRFNDNKQLNINKGEQQVIDEWLYFSELYEKRMLTIEKLSDGEKKILSIGIGLMRNPKILFLEEPYKDFDEDFIINLNKN